MKALKPFLYVIYTLLFLITILMMFNNESLIATFEQESMYRFWMYWALLGFILLMIESVFENIHLSSFRRKQEKLNQENTELKARLYDRHVNSDNPTLTPSSRPYTRDKDNI